MPEHQDSCVRRSVLGLVWEGELAELLEVSELTVATWRREQTGPDFTRVGKRVAYRLPDILDWIKFNVTPQRPVK